MKHLSIAIFSVLFPALVAAACTATTEGTATATSGSGGKNSGGDGGSSSGNSTGSKGGDGGSGGSGGFTFATSAGSGAGGAGGNGGGCVGTTQTATLVPLDMYMMLDTSGSMLDKTANGTTKWDAVKQAFTAFLQDMGSVGMGVGLQYFPLNYPGVPSSCTNNNQCGTHGPCALKSCSNVFKFCTNNQDCPGATCTNVGQCSNDPTTYCLPLNSLCQGNKGICTQVSSSFCVDQVSCDVTQYATPAVNIDLLPGAAQALINSMNAKTPTGGTPTAGALSGAISQATTYAMANPTHKVVAVLATDGLPTYCTPQDFNGLSAIAATGYNGNPSIPTFVIGVFAGTDTTAKTNLDMLAAAGGTTQAFIVDTSQNVEQAFLQALNAIRGQKLDCEYQIPAAPQGQTLDYGKVNVEHTPMGSMTPETIYYVATVNKCDPTTGGWYYDIDPASGGTPTKIEICPATCADFGMGGAINIALGCDTVLVPK